MEFKIKTGDIIFITILVFIIILVSIPIFSTDISEKDSMVSIEINGVKHSLIPLDTDSEINIDGIGTVKIKDSEVYISEPTCKDKLCERMGKISKSYQSIICLPNKVIIKIIAKTAELDGIAG